MARLYTTGELDTLITQLIETRKRMPDKANYCPNCDTVYYEDDRGYYCYCDYDSPAINYGQGED